MVTPTFEDVCETLCDSSEPLALDSENTGSEGIPGIMRGNCRNKEYVGVPLSRTRGSMLLRNNPFETKYNLLREIFAGHPEGLHHLRIYSL